jgi:gliding motility-associated lipoprotein GldD
MSKLFKSLYILYSITLFSFPLISCKKKEYLPKPTGQVRLEYPIPNYILFKKENCPFEFQYSELAKVIDKHKNCWYNFSYPSMKATLYLTYSGINGNLNSLLKEAQRLVYEHTIKANSIKTKSFSYPEKKIFGNLYRLGGESASNIQFYVTDSIKHFLSGNLYFKVQPRPDSLQPAVEYLEKDIIKMIETTTWE